MKIDFTPIVRPGFVKLAERTDSLEKRLRFASGRRVAQAP